MWKEIDNRHSTCLVGITISRRQVWGIVYLFTGLPEPTRRWQLTPHLFLFTVTISQKLNDMDYKLNYLSKIFSKIDKKGIETYVISRIWNKLDNLDIKVVCQQYVKRKKGYALLDLYFPQINFGVEVNEPHHLNREEEDRMRKKEVEVAVGVTIRTIDCSKSIEQVHQQIDNVVAEINRIIVNTPNFKPWLEKKTFFPEYYREKGVLKVEDEVMLLKTDDICAIFGIKAPLRAGGTDLADNIIVWWPNAVHKNWANEMSADGKTITEYHKGDRRTQHVQEHLAKVQRRITFYRKRDLFGQNYYRFVGVYELDKEKSLAENKCVWRRISDTYKL